MPDNAKSTDTVVVCRPDQMRQAAVALSCFPRGRQPALFVLDPPPCTEAEYMTMHESYRVMRNARDEELGHRKSRLNLGQAQKVQEWSNEEIDRRVAALTPFRRWAKRNRLFGELLQGLPLRRAIFLFAATERDMSMFETVPVGRIRDERSPLLPGQLPWLKLLTQDTDLDFTRKAWQLIREGEPLPETLMSVAPGCADLLVGFHRALQIGVPLVIGDERTSISPPPSEAEHGPSTEAVLIEAADNAVKLVAVQYTVQRNARLCVCPEPETGAIEKARQRVEAWQEGKLPAENPLALLLALGTAVSQAVPDSLVDRVGDLPLTAFTAGVPYHFLRKGSADWSHKPIGLMAGDEFILTSIALYRAAGADGPHFNILFDPGYFNPRETDGVLRELRSIPEFPLLLQRAAASNTALIALAAAPVDLIYFNTHGSASAMELRDMPLPGYKLLQRLMLRHHPIVFNNACLSWTGVGREFIATGARSFLGTLWSVNADQAATYALAVTKRMVQGDRPVPACMHETGADPVTEKAYVFVGPVSTRLRNESSPARSEKENLQEVASALLQLATYVATSGPPPDSPITWPTISCLLKNAQELCNEWDRRWPEPSVARIRLLTDQLALGAKLRFDPATSDFYAKLGMRGLKMLEAISWKSLEDHRVKADFQQGCARIARKVGQLEPAANLLMQSAQGMEQEGINPGSAYLDLCDVYREMGKNDYALESALRAKEAFAAHGDHNREVEAARGLMLACGRLAQLWRRGNMLDQAAAAAIEGYRTAERVDDVREQASFRMDMSRIAMVRGDYKAAVQFAEEALQKALWSRDDDLKVSAYGTLSRALIFAGDLQRARSNALEGRDLALERDIPSQVADFQMDLSDVARQGEDPGAALAYLREADDCLSMAGQVDQIKRALEKAGQLLAQLNSWDALREVVLLATAVLPVLERSDRSSACTFLVHSVLKQIKSTGWQGSRDGLWRLRSELQDAMRERHGPVSEQTQFVFDLLQACYDYCKGNRETALATMQRLDSMSAGGFQLANFLAQAASA